MTPRALLSEMFRAAVLAADPNAATARAVAGLALEQRVHIIALGKAARRMATGALEALRDGGTAVAGGVVVTVDGEDGTLEPLTVMAGDHPQPGQRSRRAARLVGDYVQRVAAGEHVLVLLSGGTSSLVAAPIAEISDASLQQLFAGVLAVGAPIQAMNAIRRRVLRWGAGRLATVLSHARVDLLVVSDVLGDDLPAIGSGPCSADPTTAGDVKALAERLDLARHLPRDVAAYLDAVASGRLPETVKPEESDAARVHTRVIANVDVALRGAEEWARRAGVGEVRVASMRLTMSAVAAGAMMAKALLEVRDAGPACLVFGGEPTVSLDPDEHGLGGRCQELALAAARALARSPDESRGCYLLAAGTDGRDGPTDAAGAIVDATTWDAVAAAGRDPARDLARHDAYPALDAARALLRTGPTGTNVNDIVVGLVMR